MYIITINYSLCVLKQRYVKKMLSQRIAMRLVVVLSVKMISVHQTVVNVRSQRYLWMAFVGTVPRVKRCSMANVKVRMYLSLKNSNTFYLV